MSSLGPPTFHPYWDYGPSETHTKSIKLLSEAEVRGLGGGESLVRHFGKFNKALWPKHDSEGAVLSSTSKQQLKRQVRQLALKKMFREMKELGKTGVAMELPGRDGQWRTCTVVPMVFYVSADYKAIKEFTNTKDKYISMRAFCWQCVILKHFSQFLSQFSI